MEVQSTKGIYKDELPGGLSRGSQLSVGNIFIKKGSFSPGAENKSNSGFSQGQHWPDDSAKNKRDDGHFCRIN